MEPGTVILNLAKATPDDFLAGLKSLSNQERVEVDRKMRQLEDKHQDEFSKDSGREGTDQARFPEYPGLGSRRCRCCCGLQAASWGKTIGDGAKGAPASGLSDEDAAELARFRAAAKAPKTDELNPTTLYLKQRRSNFTNPTYRDHPRTLESRKNLAEAARLRGN